MDDLTRAPNHPIASTGPPWAVATDPSDPSGRRAAGGDAPSRAQAVQATSAATEDDRRHLPRGAEASTTADSGREAYTTTNGTEVCGAAGNGAEINTVAGNSAAIDTAAGNSAAINTAAENTTEAGIAADSTAEAGTIIENGLGAAVLDNGDAAGHRPVRLAIVDDDPMVRTGLRLLFGGSPDIEVVAEAADGAEAVTVAAAHWPDVMLMDIRMPRVDGLVATQRIRRRPSPPHIIVLTTFHADETVLEALRGGASGFLLKDTPPQDIISAVRTVAAGAGTLSPTVIRALLDYVADPAAGSRRAQAKTRLAALTDRELDVALALGRGSTNAEIGAGLGMGVPTVKGHVSRLLGKLELNNRVQVALLVHDAELL